jgi:peptide deformylase
MRARWPRRCGHGDLSLEAARILSYFRPMALLPILVAPDPRLRTISKPVETIDDDLRTLIADMFETMYDAPGIGLAAIQVGVPKRLLVMDLQEEEDEEGKPIRNPRVFINPELFDPSEETSLYNEGCLSVPEQYAEVERPAVVHARWQDADGARHEEKLEGLLATCLQHEMDHLQGVLFIDHLSRLKRDMIIKKLDKARKQKKAA